MITVDSNTFNNSVNLVIKNVEAEVLTKCKSALSKTVSETVTFIKQNISRRRNINGEQLASNSFFTIKMKGGRNTPLIDTGAMVGGLKANKVDDLFYEIGFTEKSDIYSRYLHTRKNWQAIGISDYIQVRIFELFKKNLNA